MSDELMKKLGDAVERARQHRKSTEHTTDVQADCGCPSCVHYQSINDGTHNPHLCPWTEAHA